MVWGELAVAIYTGVATSLSAACDVDAPLARGRGSQIAASRANARRTFDVYDDLSRDGEIELEMSLLDLPSAEELQDAIRAGASDAALMSEIMGASGAYAAVQTVTDNDFGTVVSQALAELWTSLADRDGPVQWGDALLQTKAESEEYEGPERPDDANIAWPTTRKPKLDRWCVVEGAYVSSCLIIDEPDVSVVVTVFVTKAGIVLAAQSSEHGKPVTQVCSIEARPANDSLATHRTWILALREELAQKSRDRRAWCQSQRVLDPLDRVVNSSGKLSEQEQFLLTIEDHVSTGFVCLDILGEAHDLIFNANKDAKYSHDELVLIPKAYASAKEVITQMRKEASFSKASSLAYDKDEKRFKFLGLPGGREFKGRIKLIPAPTQRRSKFIAYRVSSVQDYVGYDVAYDTLARVFLTRTADVRRRISGELVDDGRLDINARKMACARFVRKEWLSSLMPKTFNRRHSGAVLDDGVKGLYSACEGRLRLRPVYAERQLQDSYRWGPAAAATRKQVIHSERLTLLEEIAASLMPYLFWPDQERGALAAKRDVEDEREDFGLQSERVENSYKMTRPRQSILVSQIYNEAIDFESSGPSAAIVTRASLDMFHWAGRRVCTTRMGSSCYGDIAQALFRSDDRGAVIVYDRGVDIEGAHIFFRGERLHFISDLHGLRHGDLVRESRSSATVHMSVHPEAPRTTGPPGEKLVAGRRAYIAGFKGNIRHSRMASRGTGSLE